MVNEEKRLNPTLPDHLIYARINAEPAMRRHRESFYSNLNAARDSGSTVNHRPVQVARESPLAAESASVTMRCSSCATGRPSYARPIPA